MLLSSDSSLLNSEKFFFISIAFDTANDSIRMLKRNLIINIFEVLLWLFTGY